MSIWLILWITLCVISFFGITMAFACEDGKEVSGIITLPQYISESAIVKPPYEADWYDRTYDSAYWDLPTNIYNPDNYELCLLTGWCN